MEQSKIWQYFQTAHPESFSGAATRLYYLAGRLPQASWTMNIGVGSGQFERIASTRGHRLVSMDPDAASLQRAHGTGGITSVAGKIQAIPLRDATLDAVVASEVVEHLDDTTLALGLAEIRRVLKPGGLFLGTVPFEEDLMAAEVVCPHCGTVFHKVGHMRSYGFDSMKALLDQYFDVVTLRRKAFMNTSDLSRRKRTIAFVRNLLVQCGVLTRETSLVFEARKHPV